MSPEDAKDWNSGRKEASTIHGRLENKQGSAGCLTVLQYIHLRMMNVKRGFCCSWLVGILLPLECLVLDFKPSGRILSQSSNDWPCMSSKESILTAEREGFGHGLRMSCSVGFHAIWHTRTIRFIWHCLAACRYPVDRDYGMDVTSEEKAGRAFTMQILSRHFNHC